jgi:hypothetical protein
MVPGLIRALVWLAIFAEAELWAIDFTPIVPENDPPRMRRFPRLLFKDGARTVSYVRPPGWQYSGSKAGLRLEANDPSHSIATIQEVARKTPPKFDDETIAALESALITALPAGSLNVSIVRTEKNPLVIDRCETLEITVAYFALTLDRIQSVLFVNLPDRQLQFSLNALKADFPAAHELFRRSYYTWQWLD